MYLLLAIIIIIIVIFGTHYADLPGPLYVVST